MRLINHVLILLIFVFLAACSTYILKPADFSRPIESVLKVDNKGNIEEQRYSLIIRVKSLYFQEFADSMNFAGKEIRMIRDKAGYIFMTGKDFKNVYVFIPVEGGFKLENKILISEKNLSAPAFNQKLQNIELLDGTNKYLLNNKGLVR